MLLSPPGRKPRWLLFRLDTSVSSQKMYFSECSVVYAACDRSDRIPVLVRLSDSVVGPPLGFRCWSAAHQSSELHTPHTALTGRAGRGTTRYCGSTSAATAAASCATRTCTSAKQEEVWKRSREGPGPLQQGGELETMGRGMCVAEEGLQGKETYSSSSKFCDVRCERPFRASQDCKIIPLKIRRGMHEACTLQLNSLTRSCWSLCGPLARGQRWPIGTKTLLDACGETKIENGVSKSPPSYILAHAAQTEYDSLAAPDRQNFSPTEHTCPLTLEQWSKSDGCGEEF